MNRGCGRAALYVYHGIEALRECHAHGVPPENWTID